MKTIPVLGTSLQALSPVASAQQRVNVFFEQHTDGDKSGFIVRGTPGLTKFCQLPQSPIRGMLAIDNYLYVVADNGLYQIGATGNYSLLGTFGQGGQSSPVEIIHNPTQIMIVDGSNGAYYYLFSNLVNQITVQVASLQSELIDVTTIGGQYSAQSSTPTGGNQSATNTGVVPRVVTPRLGSYRGGKI